MGAKFINYFYLVLSWITDLMKEERVKMTRELSLGLIDIRKAGLLELRRETGRESN